MNRTTRTLVCLLLVSFCCAVVPSEVLARIVNPYAARLREAKAEFKKAEKHLMSLIQSGNADFGRIISAAFAYTRARSRYDAIKKLYDEWKQNHKEAKPSIKTVRITNDVPWLAAPHTSAGAAAEAPKYETGQQGILPGGCVVYPMPRALYAVEGHGSRSAVYYRVVSGANKVRRFVNQDVKMKGIFVKDRYRYSGTVRVLKVKGQKPNDRFETKKVTIERRFRQPIIPMAEGQTDSQSTAAASAKEQKLGIIARTRPTLSVRLDVGDSFVFGLDANPSTGYSWDHHFEPRGIAMTVPSQVQPQADQVERYGNTMICGAPTVEWFKVRAMRPGRTTMKLEYRRAWENEPVRRLEVTIQVTPQIIPPPPIGQASYYAVEGQTRYLVTKATERVVAQYVGQTVELTGEFSLLYRIMGQAQTDAGQSDNGQSDNVQASIYPPPWQPTPSADGTVRAIRVKPTSSTGDVQTKVVRVDGVILKSFPPQYRFYCIEDGDHGQRIYDVVAGHEKLKSHLGRTISVTGVFKHPDVWIPEYRPRGTVRVLRVGRYILLNDQAQQEQGPVTGQSLDNPFE